MSELAQGPISRSSYEPNEYRKLVRGLEEEPEGGDRCKVCFDYRLDKTAQVAMDLGFDYFGSALTISPPQNSQTINSIGLMCKKIYTTHYLPSDFKKNQGYKRSVEMCEETTFIANATVAVSMQLRYRIST